MFQQDRGSIVYLIPNIVEDPKYVHKATSVFARVIDGKLCLFGLLASNILMTTRSGP